MNHVWRGSKAHPSPILTLVWFRVYDFPQTIDTYKSWLSCAYRLACHAERSESSQPNKQDYSIAKSASAEDRLNEL
jgi:hypothetical protein